MLFTGVTGNVAIGKKNLAHMANWNIDKTKDIIDVVSFGSDYKEKISSTKDWTASCDGKVDFDDDSGQLDLEAAFEDGTPVECTFYLDENTFYEGEALIESQTISNAADGAADISISISGSGPLTLVAP